MSRDFDICYLLSVGLVSPTAFPFRIAKSRHFSMDAMDEERIMRTCMTCRGNGQNRLAHEIAKDTPYGQSPVGTPDAHNT